MIIEERRTIQCNVMCPSISRTPLQPKAYPALSEYLNPLRFPLSYPPPHLPLLQYLAAICTRSMATSLRSSLSASPYLEVVPDVGVFFRGSLSLHGLYHCSNYRLHNPAASDHCWGVHLVVTPLALSSTFPAELSKVPTWLPGPC
jgi:hypothetical protein